MSQFTAWESGEPENEYDDELLANAYPRWGYKWADLNRHNYYNCKPICQKLN